ncbi:RNA-binding S4 domain-containing protein [Saprospiraceae bacterium]|nr:RNA-binding S4 domain-containing protein [Saprospiraceae bacterium]
MQKETFNLRPDDEYIELIKLLKIKQIAQTGGHAKIMVENGEVNVNGEQEFRKRKKLREGDVVVVEGTQVEILGSEGLIKRTKLTK